MNPNVVVAMDGEIRPTSKIFFLTIRYQETVVLSSHVYHIIMQTFRGFLKAFAIALDKDETVVYIKLSTNMTCQDILTLLQYYWNSSKLVFPDLPRFIPSKFELVIAAKCDCPLLGH